jgi:acetyl esterase/lipase
MKPPKNLLRWPLVVVFGFLSGCTNAAIDVINAMVPTDSYDLHAGLPYGADARQVLDVYVPRAPDAKPMPVVLFFYGGSWKFGRREQYKFLGEALASHGIIAVVADYRLYPAVKFPDFVTDGANALRWVRDHAPEYGGDAGAIYVMGHSAGANIAALVALDPGYAAAAGANGAVHGFIGLAGPYAFRPEQTENIRDIFVGTGDLERTRPITYAAAIQPSPVIFLAHGLADDTVYPRNTEQLAAAVRANGGSVRTEFYDGIGHIGLMGAFARPFRTRAPVLEQVVAFIKESR